MKIKKKYIYTFITLTLILTAIIIGLTLASFSSMDVVTNNFKVGEILTEIIEKDKNDNEYEEEQETTGDKEIIKKVCVKNPSKTNSLVRVSITTRWVDPKDETRVLPIKDVDIILNLDDGIDNNTNANWYKGNDGYYYYKRILKGIGDTEGKDITEILLKSVKFNKGISDFYNNMEFKVDVKAEAVETTRKENSDGSLVYNYNYMWGNIKDQNLLEMLNGLVDKEYSTN